MTTKLPDSTRSRVLESLCALIACVVLAGCASRTHLAPVEDRMPRPVAPGGGGAVAATSGPAPSASAPGTGTGIAVAPVGGASAPAPVAAASAPDAAASRPGSEFAGQPGYYTVKVGDTLLRIGLETGQNWRDIARWNNIENPNVLEVGTVLRVSPPAAEVGAATARPVAPAARIESRPLDSRPAGGTGSASSPTAAQPAPATMPPALPPASPPAAPPAPARDADGDISWAWPAAGPVTTPFDDVRSKGVSIAGKAGDPVLAAADGRVVYAGSGLRGYGNLVIVKHNATYLTAYAHNQALLVKEDQVVRRGQKIAEMGSSDTDRVQLHFEVRRLGKPVDPARVLPPR